MHVWTDKTWMQYSASCVTTTALLVPKWLQKHSQSQKFPGGACPQTPLVLHAYAQIRHLCNPAFKILATGLLPMYCCCYSAMVLYWIWLVASLAPIKSLSTRLFGSKQLVSAIVKYHA